MGKDRIKNAVSWGVGLLAEFLPGVPGIYFPLLHSLCVWAGRRNLDVRKQVLAQEAWLGPEAVGTKSDAFIAAFFAEDEGLRAAFAPELERGDFASLRAAFASLYPVLGLGEVFLKDLFREELGRGDYRAVAADFRTRVARAIEAVTPALGRPDFGDGMSRLAGELASLGIHLIDDGDVQDMVLEAIEKKIGASE